MIAYAKGGTSPLEVAIKRVGIPEPEDLITADSVPLLGTPITSKWPGERAHLEATAGRVHRYQTGKSESAFVTDERSFSRAIDMAKDFASRPQTEIEEDQFSKLGALSSVVPGWHTLTTPLVGLPITLSDAELTRLYDKCFAYLRRATQSQYMQVYSYKRNSNHGFPDWQTSNDSLSWHIYQGIRAREQKLSLAEAGNRIADLVGADPALASKATLFRRSGPFKKPIDVRDPFSGRTIRTCAGFYTRARWVFGLCTYANVMLTPLAKLAQSFLYSIDRHFHHSAQAIAQLIPSEYSLYIDDISAYDLSVGYKHQLQLARFWGGLTNGYYKSLYLELQEMGVIAPPCVGVKYGNYADGRGLTLTSTTETARVYERRGTTLSGSVLTSLDGSMINFARHAHALAAGLGVTHDEVLTMMERGEVLAFFQGDDTIGGLRPGLRIDSERYEQASLAFGLKCKMTDDATFLMRFVDTKNKRTYRPLSRAIQTMFFRERPKTELAVQMLSVGVNMAEALKHPQGRDFAEAMDPWVRDAFGIGTLALLAEFRSGALVRAAAAASKPSTFEVLLGLARGNAADIASREMISMLGGGRISLDDLRDIVASSHIAEEDLPLNKQDVDNYTARIREMWV